MFLKMRRTANGPAQASFSFRLRHDGPPKCSCSARTVLLKVAGRRSILVDAPTARYFNERRQHSYAPQRFIPSCLGSFASHLRAVRAWTSGSGTPRRPFEDARGQCAFEHKEDCTAVVTASASRSLSVHWDIGYSVCAPSPSPLLCSPACTLLRTA